MVRTVDALAQLRRPADFRPARNERRFEARAARVIRILIGVHLHSAIARLLNVRDERLREAPRARAERLHVRDDSRHLRFLGDADHLVDGRHHSDVVVGFVANVALVDAAELRGHLCQRDHLVELRVAAWGVIQARRQAHCARFHTSARERRHSFELARARRAIGHVEDFAPKRAVRHV